MNASIECLKGVWLLKELADAIGAFEFGNNNQHIDNLAGDFVSELVRYCYNLLQNPDNFEDNPDKADAIVQKFYQGDLTSNLQIEWDNLQKRLHPMRYAPASYELGDEIDDLLNAVIKSVAYTFDEQLKPHSYHEVLDLSSDLTKNQPVS